MRWARAMRCSSTAGFQGRSTLITVLAACRFRPVEPALVVRTAGTRGRSGTRAPVLPLLLRHRAVEPHVVELALLEQRLDQVQHRRPFGEQHDLAVRSPEQLLEQFVQTLEFAGVARLLLVDQEGAVGRHAAHQQRLLQPQQVHLGDELLADDRRRRSACARRAGRACSSVGGMRTISVVRGGSCCDDRFARAAQQNRASAARAARPGSCSPAPCPSRRPRGGG